jgi:threonine dehydrogenase-like Zn-dependent dehydrogenase
VCGSDVTKYRPPDRPPAVLGHETVGTIERLGDTAQKRWGVTEGDRVLLEEYLPCGHCRQCRSGDFRSCVVTDNTKEGALRYGSTPVAVPPGVWGGYSRYQYLHPSTVLHPVPDNVSAAEATFAIPLSNGVQWAQIDGGVRPGAAVLILGPGQQGASCLLACREAGAGPIMVAGLGRDSARLELAVKLGAARTIDLDAENAVDVIRNEMPHGYADLVIDVSGGGDPSFALGLAAICVGGTFVVASGRARQPDDRAALDLTPIRKKRVTIRGARGHSFAAVEQALAMISARTPGLDLLSGPPFGLADIERALTAASGADRSEFLHIVVDPWL